MNHLDAQVAQHFLGPTPVGPQEEKTYLSLIDPHPITCLQSIMACAQRQIDPSLSGETVPSVPTLAAVYMGFALYSLGGWAGEGDSQPPVPIPPPQSKDKNIKYILYKI